VSLFLFFLFTWLQMKCVNQVSKRNKNNTQLGEDMKRRMKWTKRTKTRVKKWRVLCSFHSLRSFFSLHCVVLFSFRLFPLVFSRFRSTLLKKTKEKREKKRHNYITFISFLFLLFQLNGNERNWKRAFNWIKRDKEGKEIKVCVLSSLLIWLNCNEMRDELSQMWRRKKAHTNLWKWGG